MIWQRARFALLAGVVACSTGLSARADCCNTDSAPACGPAYRTVTVTEYKPTTVEELRTVYKTVCETEKYTAYRTECVQEVRHRTVCCTKMVPTVENRTCTVWHSVPTVEERVITKRVPVCRQVTTYTTKTRDCGHYECREVPCGPSLSERLHKHFRKNDCCDCACEPECVRTKTVRVWCPNIVCEQVPCTRIEKTWECVTEKCNVTVCKQVPETKTVQVTVCKCVTENKEETYTVSVPKCVPYEATRTVSKCVPVQEKVTVCKLVPTTCEKQVPVENCCETSCCGRGRHRLFGH
jgi:hypothetical protein